MAFFDQLFTNLFWDGEISGANPDATTDYYQITDYQIDYKYLQSRIADVIRAISFDPTKEFYILFGGEISDGGSGTINISEGVFAGKDYDGVRTVFHIPALTGVTVPTAYKDNRQLWVKSFYDFKLGSLTRNHRLGILYHYQINDTYFGDPNGYYSTSANDLFTDSDPGDTIIILGSFQMSSGNVFTNVDFERTREFGNGTINISTVTSNTQMKSWVKYLVNGTSRLNMTLPVHSSVGDIIELVDISGFGFKVLQNSGQCILFKHISTIPGIVGEIHSRTAYSSYKLICTVANTTWQAVEIRDEYVMKGYCMGGSTTSSVNVIEDMNFSVETSDVITATLDTARSRSSGVSGQLKGYCMGGGEVSATDVIEDMNFSNEISAAISATLSIGKFYGTGVNGALKGYYMGGERSSAYNVIEDMNFSVETSDVISATLDTARAYSCGVSGKLKGYCMGGYVMPTMLSSIEDMNFSNETSSTITATLNTGRAYSCGVSGSFKGYCMGGDDGGRVSVIEDMNFSDETSNVISATLNTPRGFFCCGVSGSYKGYCMGGSDSVASAVIEDMNFYDETSNVISATLSVGKTLGTGTQGYIG